MNAKSHRWFVAALSIFALLPVALSAQEVREVFDGSLIVPKIESNAGNTLRSVRSSNIVANLAIFRSEELQAALRLTDEHKQEFDAIVEQVRTDRELTDVLIQETHSASKDTASESVKLRDLVKEGVKAESGAASKLCAWIKNLSDDQKKTWVVFVAKEERKIDIIKIPFVSEFLGIDVNQAQRLTNAFARRDATRRKLLASKPPLTQPSARMHIEMIKGDAMVFNELTVKQLDELFKVLRWIKSTETTRDFIAKLDSAPREALTNNASNLRHVWMESDSKPRN